MALQDKFAVFWKRGKNQETNSKEKYIDLTEQDPENDKAHLKLAEIYEKKGEKEKAISEYLLACIILCFALSHHGRAICGRVWRIGGLWADLLIDIWLLIL